MTYLFTGLLKLFLVVVVFTAAYQWGRPFPERLLISSKEYFVPESSVRFFADYTYVDKVGKRESEQHIWNEAFTLIANARHYLLLDFFLFNDFQSRVPETTRALSRELTEGITERLSADGHMAVVFMTDPINTQYGGSLSPHLAALKHAGATIVETDLTVLKDSNILWSAIWRPFFSWWGNSTEGGRFPHLFQEGGTPVTLRSWLSLFNFKANHRKVFIVDQSVVVGNKEEEKMVTFITSSNPHDGSSAHGNVALEIRDGIWKDVLESERRIAEVSGEGIPSPNRSQVIDDTGPIKVKLLTETGIRDEVLAILLRATQGDTIELAMFYLSERKVIDALIAAANRGATIRVILDPNKDAFGYMKNGIPNRPVAKELKEQSGSRITIRWCDTHGEQCHAKFFAGRTATSTFLLLGSANFTRRNIDGFNLETSVVVSSPKSFAAWNDGQAYFERLWTNTDGLFTVDYEAYADETLWKTWVYRMMERTGVSSF